MAEPFSRKAIAKAFFDLDISDPEPSLAIQAQQTKKPNREVKAKSDRKSLLLDLPVEIRLKIYDLLLVSRFDRSTNPSWAVGNTNQKKVSLDFGQFRIYRTMEPAILRTCKQIYLEAVPVLYSLNVFDFNDPMLMFRLMGQIGDANTKLIRSLNIYVPPRPDKDAWLTLLRLLPRTATGLKSVVLCWWGEGHMFWDTSLGKDIDFARALAGLSELGLKRLRIKGHYAKPWPAYFRDQFGEEVVEAEEGRPHVLEEGHPNLELRREWNDEFFEDFSQYQEGTESLNPWK